MLTLTNWISEASTGLDSAQLALFQPCCPNACSSSRHARCKNTQLQPTRLGCSGSMSRDKHGGNCGVIDILSFFFGAPFLCYHTVNWIWLPWCLTSLVFICLHIYIYTPVQAFQQVCKSMLHRCMGERLLDWDPVFMIMLGSLRPWSGECFACRLQATSLLPHPAKTAYTTCIGTYWQLPTFFHVHPAHPDTFATCAHEKGTMHRAQPRFCTMNVDRRFTHST